MRIDIMTLFPDSVDAMLNVSILGRAQQRGYISIQSHQIRQYTTNRQMQVDDYPYGGGRGAVMQADPLYRCWSHIVETYGPGRTIFLSPCGRTFTQEVAKELKARYDHLILILLPCFNGCSLIFSQSCPFCLTLPLPVSLLFAAGQLCYLFALFFRLAFIQALHHSDFPMLLSYPGFASGSHRSGLHLPGFFPG